MQDLKIRLIVNPSCELVAVDNTTYNNLRYDGNEYLNDLTNHVSLEFLVDHEYNVVPNSILIKKNLCARHELVDGNISVFKFEEDGTFTYYKYLIPYVQHLLKFDEETSSEYYKSQQQLFYHNDKIYYSKHDYATIEDLLKNSIVVSDLFEL